jgi:SulP family sulfate permease
VTVGVEERAEMKGKRWYADQWVGYQLAWVRADVLAGITVTAYLVPQVMAYAELAGLPAETGLWAAVGALGCYALVGSSRLLSVGPESTTALMTATAIGAAAASGHDPAGFAAALAIAVALVCLVGAFVGMSRFAELLSRPVLVGYMVGIALAMIVSQLGRLTGVPVEGDSIAAEVRSFVEQLDQIHLPTFALGSTFVIALLVAAARYPRAPVALLGLLTAAAATAGLGLEDRGVRVVGEFASRPPVPEVPTALTSDFWTLLVPALGISIVGFTDNVLTARAFADPEADRIEPRRELIGMGLANLGSGLLHGFPVSSSGSRTAIVAAVGGRSQLASVAALVTTIVAVLALAPLLATFPSAGLGAVVVYAATRLIDVGELRRIARFRRSELVITIATVVAVLAVGVLYGVLIAIALSVLDLLRRVARPHDAVLGEVPGLPGLHDVDDYPEAQQHPGLMIYRYDSPLFFANAEDFRTRALAAAREAEHLQWFVLNVEAMVEVDLTGVDALDAVRRELESRGVVVGLARLKQDLRAQLTPSGLLDRIGEDQLFPTLPTAVAAYLAARNGPTSGS